MFTKRALAAVSLLTVVAAVSAPAVRGGPMSLPNLVPLRPFDVRVAQADGGGAPGLRFSLAVSNRGRWPLELESRPADTDTTRAEAWQCVSWLTTRGCLERRKVGVLAWHPSHEHFHYQDFASYELRRLRSGRVDWSSEGLVTRRGKVSYCLTNGPEDQRVEQDPLGPNPAYVCGRWVGVQGISPGFIDIYDWALPGQFVPLEGVPNGRYALTVTINPRARLHESDLEDNRAAVGVHLQGPRGGRRVSLFRLP